jgi:hypothetical protein
MTTREYDEHCEKVMGEFLDKYFYNENIEGTITRVKDRRLQVKGVDVVIDDGDVKFYIDEKAAIRYVGLKTFALELSFINRQGDINTGWLLDNKKINDYFLFVWINELNGTEIKDISSIKNVDVALVSKASIFRHLNLLGWSKNNLLEKDRRIRNNDEEYMGNILRDKCKFSFSNHLVEKPINILLPKETYMEIADLSINISV